MNFSMIELELEPFEAGRRGKPDELDSRIAHLLGSHLLKKDSQARFDLRVNGSYDPVQRKPLLKISGEVSKHLLTPQLYDEMKRVTLLLYNKTHKSGYDEDNFIFHFGLKPQNGRLESNQKAGDLGNPIAVAYRGTPNFLPWERFLAVEIRNLFDRIYEQDGYLPLDLAGRCELQVLPGLCADGKIDVKVLYDEVQVHSIPSITLVLQHSEEANFDRFKNYCEKILRAYLLELQHHYVIPLGDTALIINSNGPFIEGGWEVDDGSREAKPYRDMFGNYGCMEDSLAGEDPSKPSATGTFLARYIAVQIVGNGLADYAKVKIPCNIGREEVELNISTKKTGKLSQAELERWVRSKIPLSIHYAIEHFHLRDPALYRQIVDDSDFFHSPDLPWNKVEVKYR